MIVLFDKLAASLVAGVLFMMIFTLQIRVQTNTVEDTLFYQAKKHTLSFAETLEQDFANAGFQTTPGDEVITAVTNVAYDSTDVTTLFEFWGIASDGSRAQIRYVASQSDSVTVKEGRVPSFEVRRYENTGLGWTDAGGSVNTLVAFEIDTLDENGFETSADEARKLRIRLSNAVGSNTMGRDGGTRVAHELRWGITLAPAGLGLQGYQG